MTPMRAVEREAGLSPARAAPLAGSPVAAAAAVFGLAALYLLAHPYTGVIGDAKIYMGRALADADPAGVGQDMMFRLDGQSQFSLFTPLARWLVAHAALNVAALAVAAVASALWFASALTLARAAFGAAACAAAAVVVVAPAAYGPSGLLFFAEALAEPRPIAEAFVLLALAAFLGGRLGAAVLLLGVSAAIHPIMALAGVATIGIVLCAQDRRWLALALAALIGVALAVVLRAPVADRLAIRVDSEWLSLLRDRNSYLFPDLWKPETFSLPAVQAATILLAAVRSEGRLRHVLLAALLAGALGLAVAWAAGAWAPSLLALQAQTWRMWWLTGVMAAFALALCARRLGAGAPIDRLALAMLALAWTTTGLGPISIAPAAFALAVAGGVGRSIGISGRVAAMAWALVAAAVCVPAVIFLARWFDLAASAQGITDNFTQRLSSLLRDPALLAAVAVAAFGLPVRRPPPAAVGALAAALACIAAVWLWFDQDPYARAIDRAEIQTDLQRMTPRPGPVLWLKGKMEPWLWLRRPNWLSTIQGAGVVFSRPLAMIYREKATALVEAGLDDGTLIRPYGDIAKNPIVTLGLARVRAVCGRPDAPPYIIAPVAAGAAAEPGVVAGFWTPPAVRRDSAAGPDPVAIERYVVIACADNR